MNVLSLFDGISCGRVALDRLNIKVDKYFSSEIDKFAIEIADKNFPSNIKLGDVKAVNGTELPKIDLLLGGSPCQGFSKAGKGLNFKDSRSKLFFEFVRLLKECNPKYFLLENVNMKKEYQDVISKFLGVEPIKINSKMLSAQSRPRSYWTNINVDEVIDKNINISDILLNEVDDKYYLKFDYFADSKVIKFNDTYIVPEATKKGYLEVKEGECVDLTFINSKTRRGRSMKEKCNCLTATNYMYCKFDKDGFRRLTPVECERLQTLPDGYTEGVSDNQRYKMLGNGWTVEVISHILKNIKLD